MKRVFALLLAAGVFAAPASPDVPDESAEFTFARIQFNMNWNSLFDREAPWHHDYPYSENFFLGILQELTSVRTSNEAYRIVQLDSPDLFEFPFIYVSEPGFMELTAAEADNLREYFDRGGFAMFDDFRGRDLDNLQLQMRKVYPEREMVRLDAAHPIFNTFFSLDSIEMDPPYYDDRFEGRGPEFWGMTGEDGRLLFIANHNNDFGEYWEWVDRAEMPFAPAALSVRFGVNYLVYAMTH